MVLPQSLSHLPKPRSIHVIRLNTNPLVKPIHFSNGKYYILALDGTLTVIGPSITPTYSILYRHLVIHRPIYPLCKALSQPMTRPPSLVIHIQYQVQVDDVAERVDTLFVVFEGAEGVGEWLGVDGKDDFVADEEQGSHLVSTALNTQQHSTSSQYLCHRRRNRRENLVLD
jgi:hypothetical protein